MVVSVIKYGLQNASPTPPIESRNGQFSAVFLAFSETVVASSAAEAPGMSAENDLAVTLPIYDTMPVNDENRD